MCWCRQSDREWSTHNNALNGPSPNRNADSEQLLALNHYCYNLGIRSGFRAVTPAIGSQTLSSMGWQVVIAASIQEWSSTDSADAAAVQVTLTASKLWT